MNKLDIFKKTVGAVTTFGAGRIISKVIANNATPTGKIDKITMTVGAYALGGMIAEAASEHIEKHIDDIAEIFTKVKSEMDTETTDQP